MSWLRNHVRHFVIPGVRSLVRARERGRTLTPSDIRPFDGIVRPASICATEEAGLLYSTLTSVLSKGDPKREELLAMCRVLDGCMIVGDRTMGLAGYNVPGPEVVHSMVYSSTRRLRRFMRQEGHESLVLPGRDVWAWQVVGRREGLPTVFDPRVSRNVAGNAQALAKRVEDWNIQDWARVLIFDTGFAGSIHRAICKVTQKNAPLLLLSATDEKVQIFPKHTGSRAKAVAIEYFPKYWDSGRAEGGEAQQNLNDLIEFIRAGLLTLWLWYHVSPRRIDPPKKEAPKPPLPNITTGAGATGVGAQFYLSGTSSLMAPVFTNDTAVTSTPGWNNTTTDDWFVTTASETGATTIADQIGWYSPPGYLKINAQWQKYAPMANDTFDDEFVTDQKGFVYKKAAKHKKQMLKKQMLSKGGQAAGWKVKTVGPQITQLPLPDVQPLQGGEFKSIDEVAMFAQKAGLACKKEIDQTTMEPVIKVGGAKLNLAAVDDLKAKMGALTETDVAQAFAHEIMSQEVQKAAAKVAMKLEKAAADVLGQPHTPPTAPLALNPYTGKPVTG